MHSKNGIKGKNEGSKLADDKAVGKPIKATPTGRILLVTLVVFVGVFLDFETSSLQTYTANPKSSTNYDEQHHVSSTTETIGIIQQKQLEQQWSQFAHLLEDTNTTTANISNETKEVEHIEVEVNDTANVLPTPALLNETNRTIVEEQQPKNVSIEHIEIEDIGNNSSADSQSHYSPSNMSYQVNASSFQHNNTATTIDLIEEENTCLSLNTHEWLHGKRLSNSEEFLTEDFVFSQIQTINPLRPEFVSLLTSQTICPTDAPFHTSPDFWTTRLLFLALHRYHHKPALVESQIRQSCGIADGRIPKFDYQCNSETKYLVINMAPIGLGAAVRMGAVNGLLMGVATNRITVFVNNQADSNATFLQQPWPLASCDRHDWQCVFLPTSPCVLTQDDLNKATFLPEVHARDLRRQGVLAHEYASQRVLVVEARLNPPKQWSIQTKIQQRLYNISTELITHSNIEDDGFRRLLHEAAEKILHDNATIAYDQNLSSSEYIYSNRYTKTAHAALLYLLRPNPKFQFLSNQRVAAALPDSFTQEGQQRHTIGLPIRGSDKCKTESICLDTATYHDLIQDMRQNNSNSVNGTMKTNVILTTEDQVIFDQLKSLSNNSTNGGVDFIVNSQDSRQGSGLPKTFKDEADNIMLASLVALKLQMHAQVVMGNCCSNFHLLLFDLIREGCTAGDAPVQPMCLQEHPDPKYHICCGWTKSAECDAIRDQQAEERRETENKKE